MAIATLTLKSLSPYTQSRMHTEPKLAGELAGDFDQRTFRSKLHVEDGSIVIPAFGLKTAFADGARYSKQQIPGQGKATWTAKFNSGIGIYDNPRLNIAPEDANEIVISANSDGVRGSGKRVPRHFPQVPAWETTVEVSVLDPIITKEVLIEMVGKAGAFIGIGQYRPQNGGTNGRFAVVGCDWQED